MSLTNNEILNDFQQLINKKVAAHKYVEPELYNMLGLARELMRPSIEGDGSDVKDEIRKSVNDCISKQDDDVVTDLRNDCIVLIDRTDFQQTILNILGGNRDLLDIDRYTSALNNIDRQSFTSGMLCASMITSKLPAYVFRQIDVRKGS